MRGPASAGPRYTSQMPITPPSADSNKSLKNLAVRGADTVLFIVFSLSGILQVCVFLSTTFPTLPDFDIRVPAGIFFFVVSFFIIGFWTKRNGYWGLLYGLAAVYFVDGIVLIFGSLPVMVLTLPVLGPFALLAGAAVSLSVAIPAFVAAVLAAGLRLLMHKNFAEARPSMVGRLIIVAAILVAFSLLKPVALVAFHNADECKTTIFSLLHGTCVTAHDEIPLITLQNHVSSDTIVAPSSYDYKYNEMTISGKQAFIGSRHCQYHVYYGGRELDSGYSEVLNELYNIG